MLSVTCIIYFISVACVTNNHMTFYKFITVSLHHLFIIICTQLYESNPETNNMTRYIFIYIYTNIEARIVNMMLHTNFQHPRGNATVL